VAPFLQVILCSLTFTFFELPINNALGTRILTTVLHSKPDLVNIRSLDEAIVIGAALSLSSSAFVLQLLAEKGELPTRFGSATLGVLLMQVGCTFFFVFDSVDPPEGFIIDMVTFDVGHMRLHEVQKRLFLNDLLCTSIKSVSGAFLRVSEIG
jgi:hypothetical protein